MANGTIAQCVAIMGDRVKDSTVYLRGVCGEELDLSRTMASTATGGV